MNNMVAKLYISTYNWMIEAMGGMNGEEATKQVGLDIFCCWMGFPKNPP